MGSRLTQICFSLGWGDDRTLRCFPSSANPFSRGTWSLWGQWVPLGGQDIIFFSGIKE